MTTTRDLEILRTLASEHGLDWGIDTDYMPASFSAGPREVGRIIVRVNRGRTETFVSAAEARTFILDAARKAAERHES